MLWGCGVNPEPVLPLERSHTSRGPACGFDLCVNLQAASRDHLELQQLSSWGGDDGGPLLYQSSPMVPNTQTHFSPMSGVGRPQVVMGHLPCAGHCSGH